MVALVAHGDLGGPVVALVTPWWPAGPRGSSWDSLV